MIPLLREFSTTLDGRVSPLSDTISCIATEERNGLYGLKMVVGMDDPNFDEIEHNKLILVKANDTDEKLQAFIIYAIEKNMNERATIYAEHVSRLMKYIPVPAMSENNEELQYVLSAISGRLSRAGIDNPFTFNTTWTKSISLNVGVPTNLLSVLTGTRGSITDVCKGGEWHFDNFTATLKQSRGADNGVEISYGKNLTDLNQERHIENTATGILPYWTGKDTNNIERLVYIKTPEGFIVYADGHDDQLYERIIPVDFSDKLKWGSSDTPTTMSNKLLTAARNYVDDNDIMTPKVSMKVSFAPIWSSVGYEEQYNVNKKVALCDTVTIKFERLGVNAKAKVTKIEYDVLNERCSKITLGDAKQSFSEKMAQTNNDLNRRINSMR